MSTDSDKAPDQSPDAALVRQTLLEELKVHVRVSDQDYAPSLELLQTLAVELPDLTAFADNKFERVRVVLDWDHQLPSQFILLRIIASYDEASAERVDELLAMRDAEIGEMNLYPEFDVPDYGEIEASENYVAVLRPGVIEFEDFRFLSSWRKQVDPKIADSAVQLARAYQGYKDAAASRASEGLGGPVVIGWAPPCLADSDRWAIEIWLLTEFDGHAGKAQVFMVDEEAGEVTRQFQTDVQLA